ncbi:MAG TPA: ZIP family metal transporter [Rhizomicrobium sp.]|nr:ZIP family metal transporter [Rhizomicrobium sp.]
MTLSTGILVMAIAVAAFAATMIGGIFAISLRDRLHLVLGFSAGAVIGVAFFDLMPEALESGSAIWSSRTVMLLCAAGFFLYTLLDRAIILHTGGEGEDCHHHTRGWMGAGSFSAHSFLDGFAIGIAFQASRAIGVVVAIAVLVHDFSDGLNTVNVVVRNGGNRRMAVRWLLMDAVAPVIGAGVSLFLTLPQHAIAPILALFSGFFLYIGASDLLPESHHAHPKFFTTLSTICGAATLLFATQIAG